MAQSDPDLSEFFELGIWAQRARKMKPCPLGDVMKTLNKKDTSVLLAAFDSGQVKPGWIVSWCSRRGAQGLSPTHIVNHRKGVCRCVLGD